MKPTEHKENLSEAANNGILTQEVRDLCQLIEDAFNDVTLGTGVGLSQANAIDDYKDAETIIKCRESDEKGNWHSLRPEQLNYYCFSLSFFDAEGMRFHLPAFMIAQINGSFIHNIIFHLTELTENKRTQLSLLSPKQKSAVRSFLLHCRNSKDYDFERPAINEALTLYWI